MALRIDARGYVDNVEFCEFGVERQLDAIDKHPDFRQQQSRGCLWRRDQLRREDDAIDGDLVAGQPFKTG